MQEFFDWVVANWAVSVFVLTCIIQITPIFKCNPISELVRWVGKLLTADVMAELEQVKATQAQQGEAIDQNEIDRIRWEVLDFANSCRNGRKHTKAEFEHVIELNKKYELLLEKTDGVNGVFEADYAYIEGIYHACLRENKFLA